MSRNDNVEPYGSMLDDLAREVPGARVVGDGRVKVSGIRQDSRAVERGDLFAIRQGLKTSGALYLDEALRRGASALLAAPGTIVSGGVPVLEVPDVEIGIARAASALYGHPTFSVDVVGITGTNGKTTTAFLVASMLQAMGAQPGLLGTLGNGLFRALREGTHTTPAADDIARLCREMVDGGATHLVMEVSSHALAQHRVDGVHFRVGAFSNLTQDHLDFHGDMASYGAAKERLFFELSPGIAVLNVDDPFGERIAGRWKGPLYCVSLHDPASSGRPADIFPTSMVFGSRGTALHIQTPLGALEVLSPLVGEHNVSNVLLAVGIACALEVPLSVSAEALNEFGGVPGRLQACAGVDDDIAVFVDYAHTPDALGRVLSTLRALAPRRLVCVFGAGGDRDAAKRPLMGKAVALWADVIYVTSDNPRSEDPRAIADSVLAGIAQEVSFRGANPPACHLELDRKTAIRRAILEAAAGDVVLLAGKGHETYQDCGGVRQEQDDRIEARAALTVRRAREGS